MIAPDDMIVKFFQNKCRNVSQSGTRKFSNGCDVQIQCDFCHLNGHTRYKCFCLHGYPNWHRLYGQPQPKPRFQQ